MSTQPAIPITGLQSSLIMATALGKIQEVVTFPLDPALMEAGSGEAITLQDKAFPSITELITRVGSCDGRALAAAFIDSIDGQWTTTFFDTSRWLGWGYAIAFGDASAASPVAASDAVFTETITATGGVKFYYVEGKKTAELPYNEAAAGVQTAIDAAAGTGRWTIGGTGGTRTFTATTAGPLSHLDVTQDKLAVQTAKLTGGSSSIALTTPGGPARSAYTIAQSADAQGPATTVVVGFPGVLAIRVADMVVDTITTRKDPGGLYRTEIAWKWSGLYDVLDSFDFPPCQLATYLRGKWGGVSIGGVSHDKDLKEWEYRFANAVQPQHVDVSLEAQAYPRDFGDTGLVQGTTIQVEEDVTLSTSVLDLVLANGQQGTQPVEVISRVGSASDGGSFIGPESWVHTGGDLLPFGGTPSRARVKGEIDHINSDGDADKPVSLALVTDYAGGYLDPA